MSIDYTDLFKRSFPSPDVRGLATDSEITATGLNERFFALRQGHQTVMEALGSFFREASSASYRDIVLACSEVVIAKSFELTEAEISLKRFRSGYDAAGSGLTFPEDRTAFHLYTDGAGEFTGSNCRILVFAGGRLVSDSAWRATTVQGGCVVYLWESIVTKCDGKVSIVVLRKFNTTAAPISKAPTTYGPVWTEKGSNVYHGCEVNFSDISALGTFYDLRYVRVAICKTAEGSFFQPMIPDRDYQIRMTDSGGILVTVSENITIRSSARICIYNSLKYFEYNFEGVISSSNRFLRVPLVDSSTGLPTAHAFNAEDFDVWMDGRKLVAGTHYWTNVGDIQSHVIQGAPSLVFAYVPTGPRHIRVIKNVPYESANQIELKYDVLPDSKGVVEIPLVDREIRLAEDAGLVFSAGYFVAANSGVQTVVDNKALYFKTLEDRTEFVYRLRLVLNTGLKLAMDEISARRTQLQDFAELMLPTVDLVQNFRSQVTATVPAVADENDVRPGTAARLQGPTTFTVRPGNRSQLSELGVSLANGDLSLPTTDNILDFRTQSKIGSLDRWHEADSGVNLDCRQFVKFHLHELGFPGALAPVFEVLVTSDGENLTGTVARGAFESGSVLTSIMSSYPWDAGDNFTGIFDFRNR